MTKDIGRTVTMPHETWKAVEQQLAEPRTEQEHRWRNEVRRCQHERDAAEADRDRLVEERDALLRDWDAEQRENKRLADTLREIQKNAEAWHGPELDNGHARALKVIAEWCDAALTTPEEKP